MSKTWFPITWDNIIRRVNDITDKKVSEIPAPTDSPAYEVIAELPATLEVGRIVLYNGTLWRGLLAGESSLATGTPWPVKGYKELLFVETNLYDIFNIIVNDISPLITITRTVISDPIVVSGVDFSAAISSPIINCVPHVTPGDMAMFRTAMVGTNYVFNSYAMYLDEPPVTNIHLSNLLWTGNILGIKVYLPSV